MGITREQVFAAADSIEVRGTVPTAPAIRAQIGSGSLSTIQTHLRSWRALRGPAPGLAMPDEVRAAFERMEAEVWRVASLWTEQRLSAIEAERNDLSGEVARLKAALSKTEGALTEARQRAERAEAHSRDRLTDALEETMAKVRGEKKR